MHRPNVNCPVGAGMICYCSFGSVSRSVHGQVSIQRRPDVLAPVWSWSHVFVSCLYVGFRVHASAFAASTRFFLYQHLLMQCICRMVVHKAPAHVVNLITGSPAGSHSCTAEAICICMVPQEHSQTCLPPCSLYLTPALKGSPMARPMEQQDIVTVRISC